MSPFDDEFIMDRILNKLDGIDSKIDDLCDRVTKNEIILNTHLESEREKSEKKEKKFYMFMAIVGVTISIVEIIRSGMLG